MSSSNPSRKLVSIIHFDLSVAVNFRLTIYFHVYANHSSFRHFDHRFHTWYDERAFIAISVKAGVLNLQGISVGSTPDSDLDPSMPISEVTIDNPKKYITIIGEQAAIRRLVQQVSCLSASDI